MSHERTDLRVLIVDDSSAFRDVARELLVLRGFAIAGEAAGAQDALALVRRTSPDAVLLDVFLGEDDGFALARSLTQAQPGLGVVLTSATVDERFHRRASLSGARGYVPKQELARTDLNAFWAPPSLAEEPAVLSAGDGLGARGRSQLAVDAVRLRLDGVG